LDTGNREVAEKRTTSLMKHLSNAFFFLFVLLSKLLAQESSPTEEKYYIPQEATAVPTFQKHQFRNSAKKQVEQIKVLNRWYLGADVFGRTDISSLDNNYRYLFISQNASTTDVSFGGTVGWIFREQLALEGGYAYSKIHNRAVLNTTNKGGFKFANNGSAFFLRSKVLIEFEKTGLRRPGLWLGAGVWAVPNAGGEREPRAYIIYHQDGRGNSDTTYVSSKTTLSNQWTYGVEASAEYTFKVSEWSDASIFLRRHWGYGKAISTELTYADNKKVIDTGFIESDGTGWNFGIAIRFMTGIKRGGIKGRTTNEAEFGTLPTRLR
jgi:hypothetical protein